MEKTAKIRELIDGFHVGGKYKGYEYAVTAVSITIKNGTDFKMDDKSLFKAVATVHGVKRENVYRDIQTFCKVAWKSKPDLMKQMSLERLYGRPSVTAFIDDLARQLTPDEASVLKTPTHLAKRWAGGHIVIMLLSADRQNA